MKSKVVNCTHCEKSFSSSSNLLKHQRNVHKLAADTSKKICQCDFCGKRFSSVPNLNRHQKHKHGIRNRTKCGSCRKFYKSSDEFDAHLESCEPVETNSTLCQSINSDAEDSKEMSLSEKENSNGETESRIDCEVEYTDTSNKSNETAGADPLNSLVCKRCLLVFKKKPYLVAHSKRCKGTKYADIFKACPVSDKCYFKYRFRSTLRLHLKKVHDYDIEPPENLQCKKCLLTFTKANSMRAHTKVCQGTSSSKLISCPISSECRFKARFKDTLSLHLKNVHKFDISPPLQLKFNSFEEFKEWKKNEEYASGSQFTSQSGEKRGMNIFYCQRDGSAKPHKSSPRKTSRTIKKGRVKTGAFCPANMRYKIHGDGTASVRYYPTHSHPVIKMEIINHPHHTNETDMGERLVLTEEISNLSTEYEVTENDNSNIDCSDQLEEVVTGYKVHEDEMVAVLYLPSDSDEQKSVIQYATVVAKSNNAIDIDKAASVIEIHSSKSICSELDSISGGLTTTISEIDVGPATAVIEIDSVNSEVVASDDVTTTSNVAGIDPGVTVIKFQSNDLINTKWTSSPAETSWEQKIRSTVNDVILLLDNNTIEENVLSQVWQSLNTCRGQLESAVQSSNNSNHDIE